MSNPIYENIFGKTRCRADTIVELAETEARLRAARRIGPIIAKLIIDSGFQKPVVLVTGSVSLGMACVDCDLDVAVGVEDGEEDTNVAVFDVVYSHVDELSVEAGYTVNIVYISPDFATGGEVSVI